jgi:hypothetical protein
MGNITRPGGLARGDRHRFPGIILRMAAVAALVGMAVTMAYLLFAGPTFHWLDAGELVASAVGLGVAHPPGHALHALVSKLFCLLPVGTVAFRVTLASAVTAGGASAATTLLCHQVVRRAGCRGRIAAGASAFAGLVLGFSYGLWFQAVRAEVYALNLLVLVTGVALVLRGDRDGDRRFVALAALVCGLGLGNHHFLVLLALPAVLLFLVLTPRGGPAGPRPRRLVAGLVASGGLGLAVLAYLPLRAARAPLVDWGHPTTLERFGWVISAAAFQKTVSRAATEGLEHRVLGGLFTVGRGIAWDSVLGLLLLMAGLVGLYLLWRRAQLRRLGLLLTTLIAFNLLSPVLVGLDPYNPDAYGYLCVSIAFLCPGLAVALAALLQLLARRTRWLSAGLTVGALALLGWQVSTNLPRADLRRHWAAEETGRELSRAPPGAVLLTSYFESVFNLWALRAAADLRPDLVLLHRNFLATPGYVEQLRRRAHPLAAAAARWREAGGLTAVDLARLPRALVEYDTGLPPDIVGRLQPAGLVQRFGAARAGDLEAHRRRIARWESLIAGELADNETRRAAVWTHYLLASFGCARGDASLYRLHLDRARRLAPQDRTLDRLDARCAALR